MAFGRHWEWRGFGELTAALRAVVDALPAKFPSAQEITDEYLWTPRCPVNVKLRLGDLKLKRRLETREVAAGGFELELWLEDTDENWPLPLSSGHLRAVEAALGLETSVLAEGPCDRAALLDRLPAEVRLVEVSKSRRQFLWPFAGDDGEPVTVELAEIDRPECLTSIGLEHPTAEAVERAVHELGLASLLRSMSYLGALGEWARGERLAGL